MDKERDGQEERWGWGKGWAARRLKRSRCEGRGSYMIVLGERSTQLNFARGFDQKGSRDTTAAAFSFISGHKSTHQAAIWPSNNQLAETRRDESFVNVAFYMYRRHVPNHAA